MEFLKNLLKKFTKKNKNTTPIQPEVVETKIETPEVEKITERLIDVSNKPLTLVEEPIKVVKKVAKPKATGKDTPIKSSKPKKSANPKTKED